MKSYKLLLLCSLLFFLSCKQLSWVSTDKGGCNDQQQREIETKRSRTEMPDTVYHSISNDKLTIHTGINFICCTPFTTSASIKGNLITMNVVDTCPAPDFNCYCRCFYTFDFNFKDFQQQDYNFELYVKATREEKSKLIKKGVIELN